MSKKSGLSAAHRSIEARDRRLPAELAEASGEQVADSMVKMTQPPSRRGKKTIAGHFDPAVSRQLRALGLEHDRSVQDLLGEALNSLFENYGKPPIA